MDNLWPNLQHYGRALFETQLGLPLLAFSPPSSRRETRAAIVWLALGSARMALGCAFYAPLPEWWYLRFLLPA